MTHPAQTSEAPTTAARASGSSVAGAMERHQPKDGMTTLQDLHAAITALPSKFAAAYAAPTPSEWIEGYENGHRDCRYAAAELVSASTPQAGKYTDLDVLKAHSDGYALGLRQVDRPTPQAAAVGANQIDETDGWLLRVHQHLGDALRIPSMPWPDPGAHGHEATGRAVHASYCALRFKVMDAIAELTAARAGIATLLASQRPAEQPQQPCAITYMGGIHSTWKCETCGYKGIHDGHPGCRKAEQPQQPVLANAPAHSGYGRSLPACSGDAVSADALDAARYRWLRDCSNGAPDSTPTVYSHRILRAGRLLHGPELEAAIDAAMKGAQS